MLSFHVVAELAFASTSLEASALVSGSNKVASVAEGCGGGATARRALPLSHQLDT